MITEERLLELGFIRVDSESEEKQEFYFFLLDLSEDLFLMSNCSDEDNAFIIDTMNEVKINISDEETLKHFIELLRSIMLG